MFLTTRCPSRQPCVYIVVFTFFILASNAASPWPVAFSSNTTVGPDGPWNVIDFPIDFPDQVVSLIPSLIQTSVIVNATACEAQDASCPLPLPGMWKGSGAQSLYESRNSGEFEPSAWEDEAGIYTTNVMGLKGDLHYISQRFSLEQTGSSTAYLDGIVTAVADNVSVTYPGGAYYTMDTGYLSLYGRQNSFGYTAANGSVQVLNLTLPKAYLDDAIPSTSYGLHMGSASQNIPGSLFLGGYDSSRCIETPISTDSDQYLYLADISLGVTEGGSAFINTSNAQVTDGLLRTNTSSTLPLSARPDPGVPYLYLPGATCDAIAAHLPVTYNSAFDLYFWDTTSSAFESIVSSPHYLSFSFHTSGQSGAVSSIYIPFALLNLTLESPLVTSETAYFPCRPYDNDADSGPTTILGRAFLQGAFLAQNWQSQYLWLAQAPGPDFKPQNAKTIDTGSTTLAPMSSAPLWNATWTSLKPLSGTTNGTSSTTPAASATGGSSSGLSTGAKAGIGIGGAVGGIALLGAIVGMACWRRRRTRGAEGAPGPELSGQPYMQEQYLHEVQGAEVAELLADHPDGHHPPGIKRQELSADRG